MDTESFEHIATHDRAVMQWAEPLLAREPPGAVVPRPQIKTGEWTQLDAHGLATHAVPARSQLRIRTDVASALRAIEAELGPAPVWKYRMAENHELLAIYPTWARRHGLLSPVGSPMAPEDQSAGLAAPLDGAIFNVSLFAEEVLAPHVDGTPPEILERYTKPAPRRSDDIARLLALPSVGVRYHCAAALRRGCKRGDQLALRRLDENPGFASALIRSRHIEKTLKAVQEARNRVFHIQKSGPGSSRPTGDELLETIREVYATLLAGVFANLTIRSWLWSGAATPWILTGMGGLHLMLDGLASSPQSRRQSFAGEGHTVRCLELEPERERLVHFAREHPDIEALGAIEYATSHRPPLDDVLDIGLHSESTAVLRNAIEAVNPRSAPKVHESLVAVFQGADWGHGRAAYEKLQSLSWQPKEDSDQARWLIYDRAWSELEARETLGNRAIDLVLDEFENIGVDQAASSGDWDPAYRAAASLKEEAIRFSYRQGSKEQRRRLVQLCAGANILIGPLLTKSRGDVNS